MLALIASGILLIKFSEIVVDRSIKIADILNISNFTVGFIFIAIMTSLPEFFVSTMAAIDGSFDLAFGNTIGSNIVDICLVLGISAIFARSIKFSREEVLRNTQVIFLLSVLIIVFLYFNGFPKWFGVVLILLFFAYCFLLSKTKLKRVRRRDYSLFETIGIIIGFYLSFFGLMVSASVMVNTGIFIARTLGLPEFLLGLVFYSISTSLPELMVNLTSLRRRVHGLAIGNILGSCVVNLTLVLGTSVLVSGFSVIHLSFYYPSLLFLLFVGLLLDYNLKSGELTYRFGLLLVVLYILFIAAQSALFF